MIFHLEKVFYAIRCARPVGLGSGGKSCLSRYQSPSHPCMVPHLPLPVCPSGLPASSGSAPTTSRLSLSFSGHRLKANKWIKEKERRMMFLYIIIIIDLLWAPSDVVQRLGGLSRGGQPQREGSGRRSVSACRRSPHFRQMLSEEILTFF